MRARSQKWTADRRRHRTERARSLPAGHSALAWKPSTWGYPHCVDDPEQGSRATRQQNPTRLVGILSARSQDEQVSAHEWILMPETMRSPLPPTPSPARERGLVHFVSSASQASRECEHATCAVVAARGVSLMRAGGRLAYVSESRLLTRFNVRAVERVGRCLRRPLWAQGATRNDDPRPDRKNARRSSHRAVVSDGKGFEIAV